MVTFTTNKGLGLPTVGGDVGVWGAPLNNNSSTLDASLGGSVTVPLSTVSGALTLLASNYSNVFITFTGALTQTTAVTFPAVGSFYTILNLTTNSSSFVVVIQVSGIGGARQVCPPPGIPQDIMTDASVGPRFKGLPPVGSLWEYSGSSSPNWNDASIPAPWLNCDGTAFSSATYPYLPLVLGGTTLPDSRGRYRATLNQGTARITSAQTGVDGNTLLSAGGTVLISSQSLPSGALTEPSSGHVHAIGTFAANYNQPGGGVALAVGVVSNSSPATTGITFGSSSPTGMVPPTYIGGLTLIRAG